MGVVLWGLCGLTASAEEAPDPRAYGVGRIVADLGFTDIDGDAGRLSDFAANHALVIAVRDVGCPLSQKYAPRLAAIEKTYAEHGVGFLYIDASEQDTPDEIRRSVETYGLAGRHVHDPRGRIARELGVSRTTDVFVLDADRALRYRGAIDDQYGIGFVRGEPSSHYLKDAIDAVLRGEAPRVAATIAAGCVLEFDRDTAGTKVTYHSHVSRIFQQSCLSCHRDGGVAPFALDTYERVRGRRAMIRTVLEDQIMPPWHAAGHTGPWINDRSLPDDDRRAIFAWITVGCPEGDPADAPPPVRWPHADGWRIGEPNAIVRIPDAITIPAEGAINYKYAYIKTDFPEDRWVTAIEIRPTAPRVVHHVLVFLEDPPTPGEDKRQVRRRWQGGLGGYFAGLVPGDGATIYPRGTAKKLPKGAWLKVQLHYTANGTPATDQTEIGLVFADAPPERELHTAAVAETRFEVPPGAPNHPVMASTLLPPGTLLHGFSPHMHLRGKAFRYELTYADGRTELLLDVPRFDFNWQTMYRLREPKRITDPARLTCTAWFDNSAANPANPDPTATVRFGEQTWDEMMIGYYEWSRDPGG